MWRSLALVSLVGCGRIAFDPLGGGDGGGAGDGRGDTPPALVCGAWSTTATRLVNLSSVEQDWSPALHPDGSILLFASTRLNAGVSEELYVSMFSGGTFQAPTLVSAISTAGAAYDDGPVWNGAGTEIYFTRDQGVGEFLYSSTYSAGAFGAPVPVAGLETVRVNAPALRSDGLELFYDDFDFMTGMPPRIFRATRPSTTAPWSVVGEQTQFDPQQKLGWVGLSPDALTMYFEGNNGADHLFEAHRATVDEAFSPATVMSDFDVNVGSPGDPNFSADSRTLFYSGKPGASTTADIFTVTRTCN